MSQFRIYVTGFTVILGLSLGVAEAAGVPVIDESFDALPQGYTLIEDSSENATASLQIGNVDGSNALIFDGTWSVPVNGQEYSLGALAPELLTVDDFQFDPVDTDGITSIQMKLDVEVTSNTMTPPQQGIFVQLSIYQLRPDGYVNFFSDNGSNGNFIQAGQSEALDLTFDLSHFPADSFGDRPDFGVNALPMSFGLVFGAAYPRNPPLPNPINLDGRMTGDNWVVEVTGNGIFKDSLE